MPQALPVVLGAAAASLPVLGGTTIFGLSVFGSFLVRAGLGLALNALNAPSSKRDGLAGGTIVTSRSSTADHQIIYGRVRIGGTVIFEESAGEDNRKLHRIIAFAGHQVESFDEVWFDDYRLTIVNNIVVKGTKNTGYSTNRFNGSRVYFKYGTDGQSAFQIGSLPQWTSAHRCRGRALLYVQLEQDEDGENFPNGVPNISATIKGKKVYDPRSGLTLWSDNPALCWRDHLTSEYGLGESGDNVDDDFVRSAADACDTMVGGKKKFTCNGAFMSSSLPGDTLFALIRSMAGMFWYAQGKWRVRAPVWTTPVLSFNEDDLRGQISASTRHSRRDNFNTVRGTFRGDASDWQRTDFPSVTNPAFIEADGGVEVVYDLPLAFTDSVHEARRISRITLERNRQQLSFTANFGLSAMRAQVGDIVNFSYDRLGWSDKSFEVAGWRFIISEESGLMVEMTLQEITSSVFDEVSDGDVYERDNTSLPDAYFVPDVGITLSSVMREFREKVANELSVIVASVEPYYVDRVQVQYKSSTDTDWIHVGYGKLGKFLISDLSDGVYTVRASAFNTFGVRSENWTEQTITIDSISQVPDDVSNLVAEVNGARLGLTWTPVEDIDLSHYTIRFSPVTVGATWANSVTLVPKVSRPSSGTSVPSRAGTYMVRAVDKAGIQSQNYTSVIVVTSDLESFSTTLTQTEDPSFAGTKNGCGVVSGELRIAAFDLFDSLSGNIDSLTGQWDNLGASYTGDSATYDFSTYIDAVAVRRCRVRVDVYSDRFDTSSALWDDLIDSLDSHAGLWDDLTANPQFDDTDVVAYVSTTDDDPSGSPTWTDYRIVRVADISARAFRFRIALLASSATVTPSIGQLDAIVEYN